LTFTFDPGNGPCSQDDNVGNLTQGATICAQPRCHPRAR
jgi:hypothetical protein